MGKSVFLSYPRPYNNEQQNFIEKLSEYLVSRGYEPRTLGVTDYDMDAPLKAINISPLRRPNAGSINLDRTFLLDAVTVPDIPCSS